MPLKTALFSLLLLLAPPALATSHLAAPHLATASLAALSDNSEAACPETREFIEPYLNTRPEDGLLYERQRQALRMHIDDILNFMGGIDRAYAIAAATRDDAEEKIAAGASGAERRYHQDTILRADALIEILNCMTTTDDARAERPPRAELHV